nr:MAG TPA: Structural Protein [Bacteriophage sp.]
MAGLFTIGATPRFTPLGANDKSARSLPVDPSERPSHLPKFYFFAAQGTMKDQIISGAAAKNLYGSETFDEHGKFFKHTTKFLIGCTGAGQQVMAQRLLPSDIGPRSNLSLYIDLLEAEIPNYKRTSTGDIVKDVSGAPVVDDKKPNVKGYYVKFVTDYNSAEEPTQAGLLTSKPGVMMQEVTTMIDDPNGETEEVDVHTGKYRLVKVGTGKFDTVYDENPNPTKEELVAAEYKPKIKAKLEAAEADNNGDIEFKEVTIKWDKIVSIQDLEDKAGAADEATKETYGDIYIDTIHTWTEQGGVYTPATVEGGELNDPDVIAKLKAMDAMAALQTPNVAFDQNKLDQYPWSNMKIVAKPETFAEIEASNYKDKIDKVTADIFSNLYIARQVEIMEDKLEEIIEKKTQIKKIPVTKEITSTMYPIMEWRAKDYGKAYDNYGFSINSPFLNDFNKVLAKATKKYPYSFSIYTRPNEKSSGTVYRSLYGENEVEVLLASSPVIDPSLEQRRDLLNVFKTEYYNEKDPIKPYKPFAFLDPFIYDRNIELVLKKFLETEQEAINFEPALYPADNLYAKNIDWYDFNALNKEDLEDQFGLINPFTCKTSKNVKLQTVRLSEERPKLRDNLKEVNMSVNKPIFLQGGSDGTLDDAHFEEAIKLELAKYADPDSEVQELAYAIESCIWDSGFTLDVKKELINIISIRKDTMVCLGTHTVDGSNPLPTSKARAIATALEARLKLNPESTYYGTSVARGIILLGAGELSTEDTGVTYPLTYDLMVKTARFAGAGNGKWKREYLFDHGENAVIRTMKNIVPEFIPMTIRPVLWNSNVIYPQRYDRENYFFPALQTVFANDTSVLNNYFTILALCDVTKVGFDVWKNFTGVISLTESEFKEQVENYATQLLSGKYARVINVTPECRITEADRARGYSYQLIFKLYANNMKTVCIYTTEVYRAGEESK